MNHLDIPPRQPRCPATPPFMGPLRGPVDVQKATAPPTPPPEEFCQASNSRKRGPTRVVPALPTPPRPTVVLDSGGINKLRHLAPVPAIPPLDPAHPSKAGIPAAILTVDLTPRFQKFRGVACEIPDVHLEKRSVEPVFSNNESRNFWDALVSLFPKQGVALGEVVHLTKQKRSNVYRGRSRRHSLVNVSRIHLMETRILPSPSSPRSENACKKLEKGDYNTKQVTATMEDLLSINRAVNMLDIPNSSQGAFMLFDLVRVAWEMSNGTGYVPDEPFPQGHFTWNLAATSGVLHGWHKDAEGLGTWVIVLVGEKLWIKGHNSQHLLPSTLQDEANPLVGYTLGAPQGYRISVIRLTPNTMFVMPPGVLHSVVTTETAVCTGGHYYAWGTMQQTLWSLIHVRISDQSTNTTHSVWGEALVRISIFFFHRYVKGYDKAHPSLPTLESSGDWENLCALFTIMELLNVLNADTYRDPPTLKDAGKTKSSGKRARSQDINALTDTKRSTFIIGRGVSHMCVNAFANKELGRTFRQDLFVPMMAWTLLHIRHGFDIYVKREDPEVTSSWDNPDARDHFTLQFNSVLDRHADVKAAYQQFEKEAIDWGSSDMKRTYDVCPGGYEVVQDDFSDDDLFSFESISAVLRLRGDKVDRLKVDLIKKKSLESALDLAQTPNSPANRQELTAIVQEGSFLRIQGDEDRQYIRRLVQQYHYRRSHEFRQNANKPKGPHNRTKQASKATSMPGEPWSKTPRARSSRAVLSDPIVQFVGRAGSGMHHWIQILRSAGINTQERLQSLSSYSPRRLKAFLNQAVAASPHATNLYEFDAIYNTIRDARPH
ncbi:hypothetical protein NMY22_g10143 [Coprinellus aureogranulatus]|nr:hypothetical protein NMY22_g10143 [Coprinellus aureogranulatus]